MCICLDGGMYVCMSPVRSVVRYMFPLQVYSYALCGSFLMYFVVYVVM